VWEFLILVEKKRITLKVDAVKWIDQVWSTVPIQEATVNREVALRSRTLSISHQDPADRFIAATAAVYDLTLITADAHLLRAKGIRTLANR
jgi:PIN domain nuclease of toxin-antitoxin system